MQTTREPFGFTSSGEAIERFVVRNNAGMEISLINYGATLTSLRAPDRRGVSEDVVLGFETLAEYEENDCYIGAIVGRYANRISGGRLNVDGRAFQLTCNEGTNQLHGGFEGLNSRVWKACEFKDSDASGVEFTTRLMDGQDGFPGNLDICARVSLSSKHEVRFEFTAVTDKPTVVNISHHGYFNLAGRHSGNCHQQRLWIDADAYTPVDAELIPIGINKPVAGTAFDFRLDKPISQDSGASNGQPRGFDHNWVLNKPLGKFAKVAELSDLQSGRRMQVLTTQPGLQFYAGQYLNVPATPTRQGFESSAGICLETQHFPDSPNQPTFPSTLLLPGQKYAERVTYRFDVI